MDLLLPASIAVGLLAALVFGYRMISLGSGLKAYKRAQALADKEHLTPRERAELERTRRRAAASWGPTMDPGLPPAERLALIGSRDRWITQNVTGSENPEHLRIFTELVLFFLQKYERGYTAKEFENETALQFARVIIGQEAERLIAAGMPEEKAVAQAKAFGTPIVKHFFSAAEKGDGGWEVIRPESA